ncbi:MAG: acyl-CoA dehydrogenase family protein [Streptosporangiaceae bacterium]
MDEASFDQILTAVRQFVRDRVMPREDEIEQSDAIPDDLRAAAAGLGLFGYALPEEYGGAGATVTQDVRLAFEFGYVTPAFRSMFGTNNGIAGQVIARFGSMEQQQAFLPRLASGELIASFALTEPEAGSSPAGLKTSARRDGADWVLAGSKRFITNAPLAGLFVVFARTGHAAEAGSTAGSGTSGGSGESSPRPGHGISVFLVDADSRGLTVGPRDHKMGQRGAWTAEVHLDDVRVPADRLVGAEGRGYRSAMTVLARGRLHIAGMCVGTAQRVLDESVAHAALSKQGGRPIGDYQLVQAMLADSYAELAAGRSLVLTAAERYDAGADVAAGPAAAKLYCSEMVSRVADRGVQIHGGLGYLTSTVVERMYRDCRLYRLYEGTSEIQKLIIARELLSAHAPRRALSPASGG